MSDSARARQDGISSSRNIAMAVQGTLRGHPVAGPYAERREVPDAA
ncbi:MAG TPA: hypothetical protein VFU17_05325 [Candidatus Limnocylindrales bacterium]|nr:hypothetical protein [Candidatus Limnocylindrales bacterium]